MKVSRLEGVAILLTAVAVSFTAGWMLRGSRSASPIQVETQYRLTRTEATLTEPTPEPSAAEESPTPSQSAEPSDKVLPGEKININTATAEELERLPGIGPTRAQAIVDDRAANGPFRIPEDLTRVSGIGEATLQGLIDYVTVE